MASRPNQSRDLQAETPAQPAGSPAAGASGPSPVEKAAPAGAQPQPMVPRADTGLLSLTTIAGHFYAKAQNLSRKLRAAYDAALSQHDLLLMPTLPLKATPLPAPDAPRELYIQRAFEMLANTAPFDATGHPAMSIPCGMSDGLPIGLMLIGKHYDESTIYRAAAAFEKAGDSKKM
jgi:Asp-tRNA(Asn)/Glu-tRNA(Gln) amidotransferase A subunit family amidase